MHRMDHGVALAGVANMMHERLRGAITTGIVPESEGRTMPATSTASPDVPAPRGTLLSRLWRFAVRRATRPQAAYPTC